MLLHIHYILQRFFYVKSVLEFTDCPFSIGGLGFSISLSFTSYGKKIVNQDLFLRNVENSVEKHWVIFNLS